MVLLTRTRSAFEAQVVAARLGAEGILWQLRGGGVDSMYPVGGVDILVAEDDLDRALELLGADDDAQGGADPASQATEWWMAAAVVAALLLFIGLRIFSL